MGCTGTRSAPQNSSVGIRSFLGDSTLPALVEFNLTGKAILASQASMCDGVS